MSNRQNVDQTKDFDNWFSTSGEDESHREFYYKVWCLAQKPLIAKCTDMENAIGCIPESAKVCLKAAGYTGLFDWLDRLKDLGQMYRFSYQSRLQRITELESAMLAIKATLERENDNENGAIQDTIWHTPSETLFDFIEALLSKAAKKI